MKKLFSIILALAMVLTMSVPAFAEDAETGTDTADPVTPVVTAELTAAQVKAIKPAAKAASYSYTKIKVTWDKIEGMDGYKVYRATSKNGKYTLVKTATSTATSYINTGRTTGKTYYYKVRGYKKIDGKTVYTKYSDVKSAYARPSKAKISNIIIPYYDKGKAKKVTEYYGSTKVTRYVYQVSDANNYRGFKVTWNKVSGASGYQLYMRQKGKTTWTSKGFYTGTSAKVSFDMEKEYEFKVRAYRKVNGKKVYGLCSPIKSYTFKWTAADLKAYMEKLIIQEGYKVTDTAVDSEQGYDIVYDLTPANTGWSYAWPEHINRYYSMEWIETILNHQVSSDVHDYDVSTYCAFVSKKATENGVYNTHGDPGKVIPLTYEVYVLRP